MRVGGGVVEADVRAGKIVHVKEIHPDESTYEGQYKDLNYNGIGVATYADGHSYRGEWHDGVPAGTGTYNWPDGDSFRGQFKKGAFEGRGVMRYVDGNQIETTWSDGTLSGGAGWTTDKDHESIEFSAASPSASERALKDALTLCAEENGDATGLRETCGVKCRFVVRVASRLDPSKTVLRASVEVRLADPFNETRAQRRLRLDFLKTEGLWKAALRCTSTIRLRPPGLFDADSEAPAD
jgi:hypothetical protein